MKNQEQKQEQTKTSETRRNRVSGGKEGGKQERIGEKAKSEIKTHLILVSEHEERNLGVSDLHLASGLSPAKQPLRFEVKVTNYVAAHDVGRVINKMGLEQQIEGGVTMSLGSTLYEELLVDKATGLPLNGNMLDYRIPSIKDVPEKIDVILVEHPKEYGVFGAHGIGEPAMGPEGATIANAVYNATGIWFNELPITRERVVAAVKGSG